MDCIDVTNYDRFRARFFANTRRTVRGCFTAALSCGATGFSSLALHILEVLASAVSRYTFGRQGGGLNIFQEGFEVVVHAVDRHSSKSALLPPNLGELANLAQKSRVMQPGSVSIGGQKALMRNLRRRLSPQAIDELVARYNSGEQTPALSREYGISKSGLRQLLLAEGVSFRKQGITPKDAEKAVHLYESGLTIKELVIQIGYRTGLSARHSMSTALR